MSITPSIKCKYFSFCTDSGFKCDECSRNKHREKKMEKKSYFVEGLK